MKRKQLIQKIKKDFECQQCGLCCKVEGFVYLTTKDIKRISNYLDMTRDDFLEKYCGRDEGKIVFHSRADHSCIFLENSICKIHEVKPYQCKVFPYKWRDEESYDYCEGIKKLANS